MLLNILYFTAASNTQVNFPSRSRVNQYPDPEAARKARQRSKRMEQGHSNPAYERHGSESSSSDVDKGDLSPPRVRRPRGGQVNEAFSSASSCDESSSIGDDEVPGSFEIDNEVRPKRNRSSYKRSKQHDLLDSAKPRSDRGLNESQRRSRRDEFNKRNPRSDSPLTIETLEKHEKRTRQEKDDWRNDKNRSVRSKKRDTSPSRSYEGSETTGVSLVTEGTEFSATTASSGQRFAKNPSLRRNSPSRSSSHRRYRKDNEKDSTGRRKPRRTRSSDRQSERSRSPGGERRSRSGSTGSNSGSYRSSRSRTSEYKKMNKEQAMLPIFSDKKQSSV